MSAKRSNGGDLERDFDEAVRLRNAGELVEAEALLLRLARQHADDGPLHLVLGDVQERLGELSDAADSYRRATTHSPNSELASISLFHALLSLNDSDGAFDEMRRFRSRRPSSPEYDRLLSDLNRSGRE